MGDADRGVRADSVTSMLTIPGAPVPKGRARKGRGGHWYTPEATRNAEERIALLARSQRVRFGSDPVNVSIVFHVAVRDFDIDNLVKCVLDGLTKGEAWDDDVQVCELHARYVTVERGQEQTIVEIAAL